MPRKPREIVAGGIYHVFARGNNRQPIFVDDRDRRIYLWILGDVASEFGWSRLGHCLMDNHIHLLIELSEPNLSEGMHRLQLRYTRRFNHRHGRTGHLFGGRYKSVRVTTDRQLAAVTTYVMANPVQAGLCERPENWPWTNCEAARRVLATR